MSNIEFINDNNLKELLDFPDKEYYYNHKLIDSKIIDIIFDNRNLNTRYTINKGIIINRCNGKYLPSDIVLYSKKEDYYFDRNQALELNIALPIYIIHISKDKLWYFIKTYNYYCWVHKDNVCIIDTSTFNKYVNPKNFIITIDKIYTKDNKYLDMGIKLPIYEELEHTTKVIIPNKDSNNKLEEQVIELDNNKINKGYLQYSNHMLYIQALKYLNTNYGWGGMNNGIDCSGFISNIYKVFGYLLPRDTSKQQQIVGIRRIYTNNMNYIEKYKIVKKINIPAILYLDGHVMLLLKNIGKETYVIHASSNYKKVVITKLDSKTINRIQSIHFINN